MLNSDYIPINKDNIDLQANGFLSLMALVTRTGVFTYQRLSPDGTVETIRQLRHPDEVFSEETMASLMGLPITNEHPRVLVSPENSSDLIVGMSSDRPKKVSAPIQGDKEDYIEQHVTFFDSDTIEEIRAKEKSELSLGYSLNLEDSSGVWNGHNYDAIQRSILYNHLAILKPGMARGGRNLKVIVDGKDQEVQLDGLSDIKDGVPPKDDNNNTGGDMKVFKHGGKEYEVNEDTHSLLTTMVENGDSVTAELKVAKEASEKLTAQNDEYKAKLEEKKNNDDKDAFTAAVKARVALESQCAKVLGADEALDGLSERELQEKVIAKVRPTLVLTDKSDPYVEARFEICIEDFNADADNGDGDGDGGNPAQKKLGKNATANDGSDEDPVKKARDASWARSKELYKTPKAS